MNRRTINEREYSMTRRIGLAALALSALAILSPSPAEAQFTFYYNTTSCSGTRSLSGATSCYVVDPISGVTIEGQGNFECQMTLYCADGVTVKMCWAFPDFGDGPGLCAGYTTGGGHIHCKSDYGPFAEYC
jgi:hypothetical protein